MHLLRTDTYEVVRAPHPTPPYAILSHRWESEEIVFHTIRNLKSTALHNTSFPSTPASLRASAVKIRGACAIAQKQGYQYIWIDTCCIDKTNSEELRSALNAMFKWYRNAAVCFTYFNDVTFSAPTEKMFMSDRPDRRGQASEWFDRGWTLQELIAPRQMQFFDKHWKMMGTRSELANLVGRVAGISPEFLNGKRELSDASCAMKMSWMAGRVTQQIEDIAYSLIGLFDVHLEPIYGEGTRAFIRLQEAIMSECGRFDESLFAWERPQDSTLRCYRNEPRVHNFGHNKWGLLAPSPDCFKKSGDIFVYKDYDLRPAGGFRRSHQGIFFTMPPKEVNHRFGGPRNEITFPLNCWRTGSSQTPEAVVLKLSRAADGEIFRSQCNQLSSQKGAKASHKGGVVIAVAQPQIGMHKI